MILVLVLVHLVSSSPTLSHTKNSLQSLAASSGGVGRKVGPQLSTATRYPGRAGKYILPGCFFHGCCTETIDVDFDFP